MKQLARISILILVALASSPLPVTQAQSTPTPAPGDEIVPREEAAKKLKELGNYLHMQDMNPLERIPYDVNAPLPLPGEVPVPPSQPSVSLRTLMLTHKRALCFYFLSEEAQTSLQQQAEAAGVDLDKDWSLLAEIPARGLWAREDFLLTNLTPIKRSMFNVIGLAQPVKRKDLDQLSAAVDALKKYQQENEQPFLQKESGFIHDEASLIIKIHAIQKQQAKLVQDYQIQLAHCAPSEYNGIKAEEAQKLAVLREPLTGLKQEWTQLDQAEHQLANTYQRKLFTFEIPPPYEGGNQVTPLIDGVQVFGDVEKLLQDVVQNANGNGYVHFSFWDCDINTPLPSGKKFGDALREVAAAGNEVRLLLWDPAYLATKADPGTAGQSAEINKACKDALKNIPNIQVILAEHPATSGAYHEKSMMFFNGAKVTAIVGGLNMDKGEVAQAPHVGAGQGWNDVHDVAVEISGPATRQVEEDFLTRWYTQKMNAQTIRAKGPRPTAPQGEQDVRIAVTRPTLYSIDYSTGTLGNLNQQETIHDELLERIQSAQKFIYLENYAIHEESLVSALGLKVRAAKESGDPLPVILLIHDADDQYSWLHYITYLHLSFMGCDSFTYKDDDGGSHTVEKSRDGLQTWSVGKYDGNWYENTEVYWDTGHTKLTSITSFSPDHPLYTLKYIAQTGAKGAPVWIHSKVSIFDDEWCGIGSANFNPRSMFLDGEITAFIHGSSVPSFRQTLWNEYFPNANMSPAQWQAAAEANLSKLSTLPGGQQYVLPLHMLPIQSAADKKVIPSEAFPSVTISNPSKVIDYRYVWLKKNFSAATDY